MNELRDKFSNAFRGNCGDNGDNGMATNLTERNNGMATNLTETNNVIARQSNLVDEIMALKKNQRQPETHQRIFVSTNSFNENINTHNSIIIDEIVSNLRWRVNSLSVTDQQEAHSDIHGLRSRNYKEDPLELSIWMNEMDECIRKGISGNDKRFLALRLAINENNRSNNDDNDDDGGLSMSMSGAEYVKSQKLKFLRAADWVVEAGVSRMALFFEMKLEYFGSGSLIRDLTMQELSPTDLELWRRHGFLQLSEEMDASGRAIMVFLSKEQVHLPIATVVRCLLYLSTILTRDEAHQLAGYTQLFWSIGHEFVVSERSKCLVQAFTAIPLRGVAKHFCYDNSSFRNILIAIAQFTLTWGIIRLIFHSGTAMECFYNLMTYGIPRNAIPVINEGYIKLDFHVNFLEAIKRKESDDRKRRRQARLDKQIHDLQLQTQISHNNTIDSSLGRKGITDQRGETHQRAPPTMSIEEGYNECEPSGQWSWNMSGLTGMGHFSLRSEEMDDFPDDFLKPLADICSSGTGSTNSRTQTTFSSALAPQHQQKTIQSDAVPKTTLEPTELDNNKALELPRQTQLKKDEFIIVPGVYDVILGRGRHNKKQPGNRKLTQLLEAYQDQYETCDKFQKTVYSEVVVSRMIEGGSRFLVREGEKKHGVWIEVSLEKARDKVAHDFRNLRRNAKMAKEKAAMMVTDSTTSAGEPRAPKRQRSLPNVMKGQNNAKTRKASNNKI